MGCIGSNSFLFIVQYWTGPDSNFSKLELGTSWSWGDSNSVKGKNYWYISGYYCKENRIEYLKVLKLFHRTTWPLKNVPEWYFVLMVLWGTLGYYLFGNHKDIQLHLIFDKRQACPFIGRNDFLNANHKNVCLGRTVVENLKVQKSSKS